MLKYTSLSIQAKDDGTLYLSFRALKSYQKVYSTLEDIWTEIYSKAEENQYRILQPTTEHETGRNVTEVKGKKGIPPLQNKAKGAMEKAPLTECLLWVRHY